ncbi:LysR family transcriptional regulator [Asaia sp. VD9]|uniref:LysR family transcriptional regulator n=1 Tax=Asaia sp. VD9 TaxID=3081235 RepID=UPI0030184602
MIPKDLNLLVALEALLREESVLKAAEALDLSPSAMSRTLARLRVATGDALLVRAGRSLVPTPHALVLRGQVREVTARACALLSPTEETFAPKTLERVFILRTNDGFLEAYGTILTEALLAEAPTVTLVFLPRRDKEATALREGRVDLEIGVIGPDDFGPEMRMKPLFHDRFAAVVRDDHPVLAAPLTPERFAACRHVVTSRRGALRGPVDEALEALGLHRRVAVVVPGFDDALRLAQGGALVALVPRSCLTHAGTSGLHAFDPPVETPGITVSVLWHPRLNADPAHRWLRERIIALVRQKAGPDAF